MFISTQDVKDITLYHNEGGAITVYLYSPPGEASRDFLTSLTSVRDEIARRAAAFGGKGAIHAAEHMAAIKELLAQEFREHKGRTYALFIADDFFKYILLPVHAARQVVVDTTFHVAPLEVALQQFERYGVAVFDRRTARIYSHYLDMMQEEKLLVHAYASVHLDSSGNALHPGYQKGAHFEPGGSSWRLEHRKMETFHRHMKETADTLFESLMHYAYDKLIIAGHQQDIGDMVDVLHPYLKERCIGTFSADVDEPILALQTKADSVIREYRAQNETKKLALLEQGTALHKAVQGIEPVLSALNNGTVAELVLPAHYHRAGSRCPQGHTLSAAAADGKVCSFCGQSMEDLTFLEDAISEKAIESGAKIFHVLYHNEERGMPAIGAFLRY